MGFKKNIVNIGKVDNSLPNKFESEQEETVEPNSRWYTQNVVEVEKESFTSFVYTNSRKGEQR